MVTYSQSRLNRFWSLLLLIALICISFVACNHDSNGFNEPKEVKGLTFPHDFLFGTSNCGFVHDMGCPTESPETCEDRHSDWYQWVTTEEIIDNPLMYSSGDPIADSAGQWELFAEDYARAKHDLANNSFRMTIEWSRIFPDSTEGIEGYEALKEIAHAPSIERYHQMIDELIRLGLKPLITLYHYTLPLWIHNGVSCHRNIEICEDKGWADPERLIPEIAKYAGFVAKEFAGKVDNWSTINEPFAVILPGYVLPSPERVNPPGLYLRFHEARVALLGMIEAHARMYDAIKANDSIDEDGDGKASSIGIAYNLAPVKPANEESDLDITGAENLSYLYNELFLNAIALGKLDINFDGQQVDRPDLQRLDYIGVNFYVKITVQGIPFSLVPGFSPLFTVWPFSLVYEDNDPKGLYEVLKMMTRYDRKIIIMENGLKMDETDDDSRIPAFLARNLFWLYRGMQEGVQVEGYQYFTLVDDYEWNHGFDLRFGLYALDTGDPMKKRTKRMGAETYKEICRSRVLSIDFLEAHLNEEEKDLLHQMLSKGGKENHDEKQRH